MDPDRVDRVAKLLVDAGEAPTFAAATETLRTYRLQLVADVNACALPAWQAAILTAANAGARAMHGGVRVVLADDPVCTVPLVRGERLSRALARIGAEVVESAAPDVATIAFGMHAEVHNSPRLVWASAGRWTASVSTAPGAAGPAEVPAAVLAASIAVSEVFQWLRGHGVAGERDVAMSLWDPAEATADGPPLTDLPESMWLLGLGHLGQAYAWLLSLLPYSADGNRPLVLQDDDRVSAANRATSMLYRDESLGMRKTRLAGRVLDELGWDTRLVERRYAGGPLRQSGDPGVLLGGLDNPQTRHRFDETDIPLIYDGGLGAGPDGYLSMSIRRLPASRSSREIWPADAPARHHLVPATATGAYAALEAATQDRCGVELLAGRTVATAFVGVTAACWVIGSLLRELHGGQAFELIDVSLRDPSVITTVAAPATGPPRITTVSPDD